MKRFPCSIPVVLSLCFAFACQDKAAMAELGKFKAQAQLEEQNAILVRGMFDGLNRHDAAIYQELFAHEYGWHSPSNNPKSLSRDEEAGFVKMIWVGFPDIRWNVDEVVARGEIVVARFTARGTHKAEFQGIPATGNAVEASGIWIGRVHDGKIVEAREDWDALSMMQQLGMELKPKKGTALVAASPPVPQDVHRTLEGFFKAVEEHDLNRFLSFFAPGEDLTVFEDKELNDWKGFMAYAEAFFKAVAELKFDIEKCTVDPVGPGVAVATGVFKGTGRTTSGERLALRNAYSWVLIKEGDRWRIKHVHEASL